MGFLLDENRPLEEILKILSQDGNEETIDYLYQNLRKGQTLEKVLQGMSGKIPQQLIFFLHFLPFAQAIKLSLELTKFEKSLKNRLSSILVYPLSLAAMAFGVLFLFTYFVLPSILATFEGLNMENELLVTLIGIMNIICYLILGLTLLIGITYLILKAKNKVLDLWLFLHRFNLDKTNKRYVSYIFARYWQELLKRGLSTKQALEVLVKFQSKPEISFLASQFIQSFSSGKDFKKTVENYYLDSRFIIISQMGYEVNSFPQALNEYCGLVEKWIDNKLHQVSVLVQIFAYGFIGIIVIMVYQAMMMPLSLLETI